MTSSLPRAERSISATPGVIAVFVMTPTDWVRVVRGDARILNDQRPAARRLDVEAFRGSGVVLDPEGEVEQARARLASPEDLKRRINQDFFMNAKAQAWWSLRDPVPADLSLGR